MLTEVLKKYQSSFHSVVHFDPEKDKLLLLDFTAANKDITTDVLSSTQRFSEYINQKLESQKALFGISGYNEHRTVYRISTVFDGAMPQEEPRRLHLGVDIWGAANTKVMAPLHATVHSFAFNDRFGDYGATIILRHHLEQYIFYSLYGHLSLNSITNLRKGTEIKKGAVFAEFGIPLENGEWPPHLHFQLINDIANREGDYPGVCKYSEKEKWLLNSPDPDIILQLLQYLKPLNSI